MLPESGETPPIGEIIPPIKLPYENVDLSIFEYFIEWLSRLFSIFSGG